MAIVRVPWVVSIDIARRSEWKLSCSLGFMFFLMAMAVPLFLSFSLFEEKTL